MFKRGPAIVSHKRPFVEHVGLASSQPSQESVAKRVDDEGTHSTEPQCPLVLFLGRRRLYVAAEGVGSPYQPMNAVEIEVAVDRQNAYDYVSGLVGLKTRPRLT